ncbi:MAG: SDR family oxidoreductase [Spirochaetales bacterium]
METICITGASRGIGLGFARAYLDAGSRVFACVRNPNAEQLQLLASSYPDRLEIIEVDVSNGESVDRGCAEVRRRADTLDILINNAGIAPEPNETSIDDVDEEAIRRVFNVNTLGPVRVTKALFPLLRRSKNGRVVMIGSSAGSIAMQGGGRGVPYCVSKAALNMLTRLLYFHCRDEGVAITSLHPGWVRTDMGGDRGNLSVEESVSQMRKQISALNAESPVYMDYKGEAMPW